jgi:hypothetical protein
LALEHRSSEERYTHATNVVSGGNMRGSLVAGRTVLTIVGLALLFCLVAPTVMVRAEDEVPGTAVIPTVYRDSWKVTINGKPQVNGAFTMVFKTLDGEPVKFTITVLAKMKPKQLSEDLWKELSLAAGANYKVKTKGDKVVTISKSNKKVPSMALEITDQKLSGMSLTISAN